MLHACQVCTSQLKHLWKMTKVEGAHYPKLASSCLPIANGSFFFFCNPHKYSLRQACKMLLHYLPEASNIFCDRRMNHQFHHRDECRQWMTSLFLKSCLISSHLHLLCVLMWTGLQHQLQIYQKNQHFHPTGKCTRVGMNGLLYSIKHRSNKKHWSTFFHKEKESQKFLDESTRQTLIP